MDLIRARYGEGQAKPFGDGIRESKPGKADYPFRSVYW
jgi:hypothetical protein